MTERANENDEIMIEVTIEGGLVQDVSGMPEGVRVKVIDFDIGNTTEKEILDCGQQVYRDPDTDHMACVTIW